MALGLTIETSDSDEARLLLAFSDLLLDDKAAPNRYDVVWLLDELSIPALQALQDEEPDVEEGLVSFVFLSAEQAREIAAENDRMDLLVKRIKRDVRMWYKIAEGE